MFCACSWRKHYYYYIGLKCDERFGYRIIAVNYGLMPNSKKFLLWGSHDPPVFLCVAAIDLWCSAPARRDGWPHWNFYTSPFRPIQDFIEHFCKLRSITSQGMHVIYCPTIEPWRSMNYKSIKGSEQTCTVANLSLKMYWQLWQLWRILNICMLKCWL